METVLADTSIWIDHFRNTNSQLVKLLEMEAVVCHPWIIGELACGNIRNREEILFLLKSLHSLKKVYEDEILEFITANKLMGCGIGYVDCQLLASVRLAGAKLWTNDKRLLKAAVAMKLDYQF